MTVLETVAGPAASSSFATLPADLVDGIVEAVASRPDLMSRSDVVCCLVAEIYETVRWVYGSDLQHDEVTSLALVLTAAKEHNLRMRTAS